MKDTKEKNNLVMNKSSVEDNSGSSSSEVIVELILMQLGIMAIMIVG